MLVLHGLWSLPDPRSGSPADGELLLWAEDSERAVSTRSRALRSARPHPFAATASELEALVSGSVTRAELLLPSVISSPLDSPEMVRATPRTAPRSEPSLLPWTVPAVALEPADALAWLTHGHELLEDIRPGASIRYLERLAEFAAELTGSGRVVPGIGGVQSSSRQPVTAASADTEVDAVALWRPVLQGRDLMTHQHFASALPPMCRALLSVAIPASDSTRPGLPASDPSAGLPTPDERAPGDVVQGMLAALVDAGMRRALHDQVLVPPRRGRRPRRLPAAELWLAALTSHDGRFTASGEEIRTLEDSLEPWEQCGTSAVSSLHVTFRLRESEPPEDDEALEHREALGNAEGHVQAPADGPGEDAPAGTGAGTDVDADSSIPDSGGWQLEFLVQSAEDPSLIVPARQVWQDDGSLRRWLTDPQDLLLAELGRASALYPPLAKGLRQARPSSLALDSVQVVQFLSEAAPILGDAGFGVLLPAQWEQAGLELALRAHTPSDPPGAQAGSFGRDQLCQFDWRLAIGGVTLTDAEIEALAAAKSNLVRFRGKWVIVDPDQLQRGIDFLGRERPAEKSVGEILALAALPPTEGALPLDVADVEAEGWLGDLLSGLAPESLRQVDPPRSFHAQLRPYQQRGLSWLSFLSSIGLGACLADDMGLGKTVQLLALEALERAGDAAAPQRPATPTLLLCPMSMVGTWQREAARFAPDLRVYAHHGNGRLHGEALQERLAETDLVVTTYGTAVRDIEELGQESWHRVVLDEAQAIKNSLSRTTQAVRTLRASHRVALTGTPVENRLSELWSIMDFLNPGLLGSREQFRTRFALPVERYGDDAAAGRLREITRPYILRRLKTDPSIIDDLPEKIEIKQYCSLTVEQASLYKAVVDEMMEKIDRSEGIERRGQVLATMSKLKQVCNHPAQLLHDRSALGRRSGKIIRLEEILEEILSAGDRVLCFTQFTEFAEMLVPHLAARFGTDVTYLHGGSSARQREEMVTQFQSGNGPQIFLLSLKAGGTGLTLTEANHVIHLDRWWNPAVEDQATDRAFRIGQKRNVEVHKFLCTGTLEERIDDMIEGKKALADMVVSDGEGWLTELSTNDLRSLVALSEEAVSV